MSAYDASALEFTNFYSTPLLDFIRWRYDELLPNKKAAAMALAINHNNLLLMLLKKQFPSARGFAAILLEAADTHKVERKVIYDLNAEVVRELMKMITNRLRSNPNIAAEDAFIVTQVAHNLWTIMNPAETLS